MWETRPAVYRAYQTVAIAIVIAGVAYAFAFRPPGMLASMLFFSALAMVASFLRIETEALPIGFEAAIAFAAIILFHDAGIALVAVFTGSLIHRIYLAMSGRGFGLESVHAAAELALSYYIVGLLYCGAVAHDAPAIAKVSGFVLLLIGYLVIHLLFASIHRYLQGDDYRVAFAQVLLTQGKTLLLISPIVGVEVMSFAAHGYTGFAIAFLPVLLVAYVMRSESDAERQNAELLRRNRELSLLAESSTQILSAEGDQETLHRLTGLLSNLARMRACAVVTWETNPELPGTVYRFGDCLRSDQEILRWVDAAGFAQSAPSKPFVFQNENRKFPLSDGKGVQIIIGIQSPEVIYGVLIFETGDPAILKTASLNLLALLTSQTALSLQDQLLRREMGAKTLQLENQAATMSTILEVSTGLIGSFDADAMLTRIAAAVRKALGYEVVVFALHDPKHDEFVRRAHAGLEDIWEEVQKRRVSANELAAFFSQDFRISNSYFVPHTNLRQSDYDIFVSHDSAESDQTDEWHPNDVLIAPLMSAELLIGYLSVRQPLDCRLPTLENVRTLEIFANQAVTALQSARQYEEIRRLTFIDALTPAFNHRYFQEALAKELARHKRTCHEFALAMVDIDNFKWCNDTFGHPVGDEVLKGLVQELMTNARDMDIVARYGGEEFAIVFPETPATRAFDAANRLRDLVERREFRVPQLEAPLRVTISIGVSIFPRDGGTTTDLIAQADAALYTAKRRGKNCVVMAHEVDEAQRA
jgi:diguanylate cyclase (GGDEF)-like protein